MKMTHFSFVCAGLSLITAYSSQASVICTTSDPRAEYQRLSVQSVGDAGHIDALEISAEGRYFTFFKSGNLFSLQRDSSVSPGFDRVSIRGTTLTVAQTYDTGGLVSITYSCK